MAIGLAGSLGLALSLGAPAWLGAPSAGAAPARRAAAPPDRRAAAGPARRKPKVVYPKLQKLVRAAYPEKARREGREGVVRLYVTVGADGKVTAVKVARSSGHPDLDAAAVAVVKQFVYRPATVDGKPMAAKIVVAYPFSLEDAPPPRRPADRRAASTGPDGRRPPPRRPGDGPDVRRPSPRRPPARRTGAPGPEGRRPPATPPRAKGDPAAPADAADPADGGATVLGGRIREKGTRKSLTDAEVLVFQKVPGVEGPGRVVTRTFANAKGRFRIPKLSPGRYTVEVRAPGCLPFRVKESLDPGERIKVDYYVERRSYDPYETVVTAKAERKEVSRYTVALPEIQKIPGTQGDALRAIQNMPGVARASFGSGALVVRGAAPGDTRVFLEGIEIPQLYHFFGLTSVVNSDILKNIVFVPGNYSVRYGRALGGIIDVQTRAAKQDRWHGYLDVDLWDVGALAEGPVGEGSLAVAARRSHIDAVLSVLPPDLLGVDLTVAPVYYDYQAMLDYPVLGGNLKALVFGSDDRVRVVFQNPTGLGSDVEGVKQTTLFHNALVAWGRRWGDHELKATLSGGYSLLDVFISEALRFELGVGRLNWRLEYTYRVAESLKITAGNEGEHLWSSVSFAAPPIPAEGEIPEPIASQESNEASLSENLYSQALYLEATWKPTSRLTLIPGLRLDYLRFGPFEGWVFDPRITGKYEILKKKLFLNAAVGMFHQEPFFPEIYEVSGGNPDVGHARSLHTSLGLFWKIRESLTLETTGFYKTIDNAIVGSSMTIYRDGRVALEGRSNQGIGRIYGGELLIKKMPDRDCPGFLGLEKCFGWLSYTILRSERKDGPGEPWRLFDFDQTHILTLILSGSWPGGWQVGLRFRLASGNPATFLQGGIYDADADQYIGLPGPVNEERLPLFHQLDLRVDKKFVFQKWILTLYLDIQNVYNFRAKEFVRYNFNFTQRGYVMGLPIIPSIGVKGAF